MSIDKRALRAAAEKATPGKWKAFIHTASGTRSVHTPRDKRCDNVIKWSGFDGQKNAEANAKFIAAANPATVISLLDELEAAEARIAAQKDIIAKQEKWIKDVETSMIAATDRAEATEKRIAELESEKETLRPVGVMSEKAFHRLEGSESRFIALWPRPGIYLPRKRPEDGVIVYARTAGISVKGE